MDKINNELEDGSFSKEDARIIGGYNALESFETFIDSLEKQEPQGLDEAAEESYPDFSDDFASKAAVEGVRDAFKAGAKWMAEQGLVFKTEVQHPDVDGIILENMVEICPDGITLNNKFKAGDNVIVQIRKAE